MSIDLLARGGDIVFDIGSSNTLILGAQKNILVYEPTMLLSDDSSSAMLFGEEAKGVTADEKMVRHVPCVEDGRVISEENCIAFLSHFRSKIPMSSTQLLFPLRCGVCVPSSFSTEQGLIWNRVFNRIGFSPHYYPSSIGIAAAYRIKEGKGAPQLVLECGASKVEASVTEMGRVIASSQLPLGGKAIDRLILLYLYATRGVIVSLSDCETIKMSLGSSKHVHVIRGKDTRSSTITSLKIHASDIEEPITQWKERITHWLLRFLSDLPPQMLRGTEKEGVLFAGGGAQLFGLSDYLEQKVGFAFQTISRPQLAAALGIHSVMNGVNKDISKVQFSSYAT